MTSTSKSSDQAQTTVSSTPLGDFRVTAAELPLLAGCSDTIAGSDRCRLVSHEVVLKVGATDDVVTKEHLKTGHVCFSHHSLSSDGHNSPVAETHTTKGAADKTKTGTGIEICKKHRVDFATKSDAASYTGKTRVCVNKASGMACQDPALTQLGSATTAIIRNAGFSAAPSSANLFPVIVRDSYGSCNGKTPATQRQGAVEECHNLGGEKVAGKEGVYTFNMDTMLAKDATGECIPAAGLKVLASSGVTIGDASLGDIWLEGATSKADYASQLPSLGSSGKPIVWDAATSSFKLTSHAAKYSCALSLSNKILWFQLTGKFGLKGDEDRTCLLYTSPSPRDS